MNQHDLLATNVVTEKSDQGPVRVMAMVHELHKRGHHHIDALPYLHSNGAWRCRITSTFLMDNAGKTIGSDGTDATEVTYSIADGNRPFGWKVSSRTPVRLLADRFVREHPRIVLAGHGKDHRYIGWFTEMLGMAESGTLPYAFCDEDMDGPADPACKPPTREIG